MKKISRIQASNRILKIAKAVAQLQASNHRLTPLQIAKVQKGVARILASSNIDNQTMDKIAALQAAQDDDSIAQKIQSLMKNKSKITAIKNKQMKGNDGVKKYLKQKAGIILTQPIKAGKFFQVIVNLFQNYTQISSPQQDQGQEEQ